MNLEHTSRERRLLDTSTMSLLQQQRTVSFEKKVLKCVDRGLGSLGDDARHPIYWYIESKFGLKREEIPEKPKAFMHSIRQMFGPGASVLEGALEREIRLAFTISSDSHNFEELLDEAELAEASERFSAS